MPLLVRFLAMTRRKTKRKTKAKRKRSVSERGIFIAPTVARSAVGA